MEVGYREPAGKVSSDFIDHHDGTVPVDFDGDIDITSIGYCKSKVWVLEKTSID